MFSFLVLFPVRHFQISTEKALSLFLFILFTSAVQLTLEMQGLLARLNQQKNPPMGSKGTSRSASIASEDNPDNDQNDEDQSDESQSQQTSTVK